jgi:hypothetical protein
VSSPLDGAEALVQRHLDTAARAALVARLARGTPRPAPLASGEILTVWASDGLPASVDGVLPLRALQEKFNTSDFDSNKAHERQSATWKTRWAEPSKVITRDLPETEGPPLLLEEPVSIDPTRGE